MDDRTIFTLCVGCLVVGMFFAIILIYACNPKFCPECGKGYDKNAIYCNKCGVELLERGK